jgi:hypothetical protein
MDADSQKPSTVKPVSSDPLRLIKWALRDATHPKLTKTTRAVVEALVSRLPNIRPSVPTIAHDAGMSERTAYRALLDLKSIGVITLATVVGRGTSYTINLDVIRGLNVAVPKNENRVKASKSKQPLTSCHPCHDVTPDKADPCHGVTGTPDIMSPKGYNQKSQSEISDLGGAQALPPGTTPETGETVQVKTPAECRTVPMYPQDVPPCSRCGRVSHGDAACLVQPSAPKPLASPPPVPVGNQLALLPLSADVGLGSDEAPQTQPSPVAAPVKAPRAKRAPKQPKPKCRRRILAEAYAAGMKSYTEVGCPVPHFSQDMDSLEAVADARCEGLDDAAAAEWIKGAVWRWMRARARDDDDGKFFPGGKKVAGFEQWIATETPAAEREGERIRRSMVVSREPFSVPQESSPVMVEEQRVELPEGYKPTLVIPNAVKPVIDTTRKWKIRPVRTNQEVSVNE